MIKLLKLLKIPNLIINILKDQKKLEKRKIKKIEEKKIPGNGFLWNNKPKNYNYNYDYTKHENADKIINKSNQINLMIIKI